MYGNSEFPMSLSTSLVTPHRRAVAVAVAVAVAGHQIQFTGEWRLEGGSRVPVLYNVDNTGTQHPAVSSCRLIEVIRTPGGDLELQPITMSGPELESNLHWADYIVIVGYFLAVLAVKL